jgi:two-component system phosphate regulon sensor histidine kinase PhoR
VKDLLDLGQMDVGIAPSLNISDVSLAPLVGMVWKTLEPLANRKQISLNCEGNLDLNLQGDESRLYRLLLNLLDNSIKHSPVRGVITIRAQVIDAVVQIETIDCGDGFPEEALAHIFDRFYRIDASRTRSGLEHGGSGLGLAIAYQIVQLHQGKITARNDPQTGGAWMTIQLPQFREAGGAQLPSGI